MIKEAHRNPQNQMSPAGFSLRFRPDAAEKQSRVVGSEDVQRFRGKEKTSQEEGPCCSLYMLPKKKNTVVCQLFGILFLQFF